MKKKEYEQPTARVKEVDCENQMMAGSPAAEDATDPDISTPAKEYIWSTDWD